MIKSLFFIWTLFALSSLKGGAYEITSDFESGYYWEKLPMEFSVVDDQSFSQEEIKKLETALSLAIKQWNEALEQRFFIWKVGGLIDTLSPFGSNVYWDRNFAKNTGLTEKHIAVAIRYTSIPYIKRSNIVVNADYKDLSLEKLEQVFVHELGHTIGLDHSKDESSVMLESLVLHDDQSSWQKITQDDLNGVQWLMEENRKRQDGTSSDPSYLALENQSESRESDSGFGCGRIEDRRQGPPGEGPFNFIVSLLMLGTLYSLGKKFTVQLATWKGR